MKLILTNELCRNCGDEGYWWCGCECCDEKFMLCKECGKDLPDATVPMNSMNQEKFK
jgi:hypothetical protein